MELKWDLYPTLFLCSTILVFLFPHSNLATQLYTCEWFMVYHSSDRGVVILQSTYQEWTLKNLSKPLSAGVWMMSSCLRTS